MFNESNSCKTEFNDCAGKPYNPATAFHNILEVFDNITHSGKNLDEEQTMEQLRLEAENALGVPITLDQVSDALLEKMDSVASENEELGRQLDNLKNLADYALKI